MKPLKPKIVKEGNFYVLKEARAWKNKRYPHNQTSIIFKAKSLEEVLAFLKVKYQKN